MPVQKIDWNPYRFPPQLRTVRQEALRQWWQAIVEESNPPQFEVTLTIATLYPGNGAEFLPNQGKLQGTLTYQSSHENEHVVVYGPHPWVEHQWGGFLSRHDLEVLADTYRNEGEAWDEIAFEQWPDRWGLMMTVRGRLQEAHHARFPMGTDILNDITYTVTPHLTTESTSPVVRSAEDIPSVQILQRMAAYESALSRRHLFALLRRPGDVAIHQSPRVRFSPSKPALERYTLVDISMMVRITLLDGERYRFEIPSAANPQFCLRDKLTQAELIFQISHHQPTEDGLWARLGPTLALDDWTLPTESRVPIDSSEPPAMSETAHLYQDWINTRYPVTSPLSAIVQQRGRPFRRAEIVFYCHLRMQDTALSHIVQESYREVASIISKDFHLESTALGLLLDVKSTYYTDVELDVWSECQHAVEIAVV